MSVNATNATNTTMEGGNSTATLLNTTLASDNSTSLANTTYINLGAYHNETDCTKAQNEVGGFGFSYSFEIDTCYLIAGPRTPPSTIPTYAQSLNGAPQGQFFKYTQNNETQAIMLNMCSRNDCKYCSTPQKVPIDICVDTKVGWNTYSVKTTVGDQPLFGMAPLATVNWTALPPLQPGQSPNTDLWSTTLMTSTAAATSTSTPASSGSTTNTSTTEPEGATTTNKTASGSGRNLFVAGTVPGADQQQQQQATQVSGACATVPSVLVALVAGTLALVF